MNQLGPELLQPLMTLWDKSITPAENEVVKFDFKTLVHEAMELLKDKYAGLPDEPQVTPIEDGPAFDQEMYVLKGQFNTVADSLRDRIDEVAGLEFHIANMTGTGYGRALLPFPEDCIRSEGPWPCLRRACRIPRHTHRARHRRPGYQGHPGGPVRTGDQLPDERPLRGWLRALSGLHRR